MKYILLLAIVFLVAFRPVSYTPPPPITLSGYWNTDHKGFVVNNPTGACLWLSNGVSLPDSCGATRYTIYKDTEERDQSYWALAGRYVVITKDNDRYVAEALLIPPDYYFFTYLPMLATP